MSILLPQNRENEAQQPGTLFTGSGIWGKQTGQTSFWDAPTSSQGQVFVFGSARAPETSNGMDQVQAMLRTMKLGPDRQDGEFTFGQSEAAPSQPSLNPRPRFSKLRKSTHPTKGKTVASSYGSMSAPVFDNVPLSGLSTQSFTFNSRASTESTYLHLGEPSGQAFDTQSSGTGPSDFNKQDQNDPSAGHAGCTDRTNADPGSKAELNGGINFRQWGSKTDEEPFQFRASAQNLEPRKPTGLGTSGTRERNSFRSTVGTGSLSSWGVGGGTAAAADFHGSGRGLGQAEAFNFEALRSCPPVSTADPFGGTEQPLEEDGNAVAAEFSTLRLGTGAKTGETPFVFTGKQSAANEVEKPLKEDGNSVAAEFSNLRLGVETQESGKTPCTFTGKQGAAGAHTVPPAPFVFTSGVQSTSTEGPAMGTSHSSTPETAPPFGFVFRAAGDDSSPASAKKNKDAVKKVAARLKKSRRASPAIAEVQGSPMDVSPCPDTGVRLSPPETANNSESEDERRPEGSNARSQSSEALVEELRVAAAELRLGNEKEELAKFSDEKSRFQSPGGFGMFTFSASPSVAASTVRQRRVKRLSSRTKLTSGPTIDSKQPEVEFHKVRGEEPPKSAQTSNSTAAEHACEKWRLRGNQAYANGDFPKAEEYYSRGASSVPPNETSQSCIRATMLCYSNRAATRMAVGRMRDALADCMRAMAVDPNFLRVRLRAGSCHLALGELEAAASYFRDCLYRGNDQGKNDMKVASEAAEGLRKCQQVDEYFQRVRDALSSNTSGDCMAALRLLNEALTSAPYSEVLLELKARCLLHLRKYEDVVKFCDESLSLAEQNWPVHGQPPPTILPKAWRSWMTAKALFHMARLEDALDQLTKLTEHMILSGSSKISQAMDADMDTLSQFSILVHDLLRYKAAGNEAFQAGKHAEAVEHYTAALACNGESRPFNAVLFCNRAAASQALEQIADAIADCSRAIVLDPKYAKAISRRATLHNMVRDYSQACSDLRRLVSLYEESSKSARKTNSELRQARDRLTSAEEDLKKNHPIDHYLILSLKPSCTAVEVKKAYRKLALRHHPDKAGNLLVRSEGVDDGKELSEEIRNDAERLFKLIGEAYAVLSDPAKRSRYDTEEDIRKLRTRSSSSSNSASSEGYHHHYGRSTGRRRDRWDRWDGFSFQRWQSGPDAAQPDTYARYARDSDVHWDDL